MSRPFVVLDWDGTVIDSIGAIVECTQRAAADVGLEPPSAQRVRQVIGLGLAESIAVLYPGVGEQSAIRALVAYREHWIETYHAHVRPFAWTEATLDALAARGLRLAVATAKSRSGLARDLERLGLGRYFSHTRTADESGSKPDPAMLDWLMAAAGVGPDETVMVGDSAHDLEMARRAGAIGVGVASGAATRGELEALGPRVCLERLDELVGWLDGVYCSAPVTKGEG